MARRYPEFIQGETVIWRITFYTDETKSTPVDPSTQVFQLQAPDGTVQTPTVSNDTGTGKFSAQYTVDQYGLWDWRWTTTTPAIASQGTINVIEKNVP